MAKLKKQKMMISPNWRDLQPELLELIAKKLSFFDIPHFKLVCSSWYAATKDFSPNLEPLLMLPQYDKKDDDEEENHDLGFMSMNYNKNIKKKKYLSLLEDGHCFGSSHGWLAVLDKFAHPFLINPFSSSGCSEIQLPLINNIQELDDLIYKEQSRYAEESRETFNFKFLVVKAILSANPSYNKNYNVIIIYGVQSKLAFCNPSRDSSRWIIMGDSENYSDVIWQDNKLYALRSGPSIEVWDFQLNFDVPIMKNCISPTFSIEGGRPGLEGDGIRITTRWYLVSSMGEFLFIERYIGEFVNGNGELFSEGNLPEDEYGNTLVCPYRTINFRVYKLDLNGEEKLLEVKSLKGQSLFLGGNHSISVSAKECRELKENSIYFSGDYLERMDEEYSYGGHDIGIFSFEDGTHVDSIVELDRMVEPIPFWVFPQ